VTEPVTLDLPEPPSPNEVSSAAYGHRMQAVRLKNDYKRTCWVEAMSQVTPTADPPKRALVSAHFRLHNLRDPDGLVGSLKYVLDAIRCPQEGEDVSWRRGLAERKGYLADDGPPNCVLCDVTQEIDRSARGVTVRITPVEEGA